MPFQVIYMIFYTFPESCKVHDNVTGVVITVIVEDNRFAYLLQHLIFNSIFVA